MRGLQFCSVFGIRPTLIIILLWGCSVDTPAYLRNTDISTNVIEPRLQVSIFVVQSDHEHFKRMTIDSHPDARQQTRDPTSTIL
ncbi:hypothetical protein DFH29DRAFT_959129 [Suillus ampliporus]|nr:hypothetical protein DFH29DRAFT_962818 [Suillus ampliporus]KAG0694666.1 hypothetical protein DFH29DRAFT_959129 [Suillus ampliporus]